MIFFININSIQAEFPASSDYLSLSRYLIFFRFTLQTFVRHLSHFPKCQFEARKDRKGPFLQSKAGEMKPFKPNWSFHCLSKTWFYCSDICFWLCTLTILPALPLLPGWALSSSFWIRKFLCYQYYLDYLGYQCFCPAVNQVWLCSLPILPTLPALSLLPTWADGLW